MNLGPAMNLKRYSEQLKPLKKTKMEDISSKNPATATHRSITQSLTLLSPVYPAISPVYTLLPRPLDFLKKRRGARIVE